MLCVRKCAGTHARHAYHSHTAQAAQAARQAHKARQRLPCLQTEMTASIVLASHTAWQPAAAAAADDDDDDNGLCDWQIDRPTTGF